VSSVRLIFFGAGGGLAAIRRGMPTPAQHVTGTADGRIGAATRQRRASRDARCKLMATLSVRLLLSRSFSLSLSLCLSVLSVECTHTYSAGSGRAGFFLLSIRRCAHLRPLRYALSQSTHCAHRSSGLFTARRTRHHCYTTHFRRRFVR